MKSIRIPYRLLRKDSLQPVRQHKFDAGIDIFADESYSLTSGEIRAIGCGISLDIPRGLFGLVTNKSGVVTKVGLVVIPGVIDCGYKGEVKAMVYNTNPHNMHIPQGYPIAQILLMQFVDAHNFLVRLKEIPREEGGFGSTLNMKSTGEEVKPWKEVC